MAGGSKGEDAKGKGNDAFRKGQFAEAIGYYTEAILSDVTNHIYYLNRSQAYLKLSKCVIVSSYIFDVSAEL
jgi:hypothetical protein